jgi:hypothetical protein
MPGALNWYVNEPKEKNLKKLIQNELKIKVCKFSLLSD